MERRSVGEYAVTALVDTTQAYPATAVYPSAGQALGAYAGLFDAEGRVTLNFASFLVVGGGQTILVDTGLGPEHNGQFLAELRAAGVDPAAIDIVTYTHLHGDHTGWNFSRGTEDLTFPNARFLVPRLDWDHYAAQQPPSSSFERDMRPLERSGRLELIRGEYSLSSALTALPTPGHTPGHTSFALLSGTERAFILGDVVITPVDAEHPEFESSFDWDHSIATATRRATMARLAADRSLVGASHLPVPGFGHFQAEAGTHRWVPV